MQTFPVKNLMIYKIYSVPLVVCYILATFTDHRDIMRTGSFLAATNIRRFLTLGYQHYDLLFIHINNINAE